MSREYTCYLSAQLKIDVVYVFPSLDTEKYSAYATKYIQSYLRFNAGCEHSHIVVCNGGKNSQMASLFGRIPNCKFTQHDNSGYDIGAFQFISRQSRADMIVFFGTSAYVRGNGWLYRMSQAFRMQGDNLYGCMGNQGDVPHGIYPHVRTTGFWLSPKLFNEYPFMVNQPEQRYPFEHGPDCLTQWISKKGKKTFVVTWNGEYEFPNWDSIPNGFHRGNQSALLTGDRLTDPPYYG
jgi:hypothetical protein